MHTLSPVYAYHHRGTSVGNFKTAVSQRRSLSTLCSVPNNLADVPHQLTESFRHWHNSLEEQASDHDYAQFWAAKAVSAAKTDDETRRAQDLYSLDAVFLRSEELVRVLGVRPAVLVEILRYSATFNFLIPPLLAYDGSVWTSHWEFPLSDRVG